MRTPMNFALFLFCVPAVHNHCPKRLLLVTREALLFQRARDFIGARRDLAKAEEVDSPKQPDLPAKAEETDGFKPPNQSSSTTKPPKEDNVDEPIKGLGPHKNRPSHRDCTPC
jgi:hypothetical protein